MREAVLSVLKSFFKPKNKEYFKSWITRIVINKSKDFIKKQRYAEELTDTLNVFYGISADEMAHFLRQSVSTVRYKTPQR